MSRSLSWSTTSAAESTADLGDDLQVLRAYIRAGSVATAAYELGIRESTARQHLSGLYRRTGCVNAAPAAYLIGAGDRATAGGQGRRQLERFTITTGRSHIP